MQTQILNLLRELQHELGVSDLFITHNIAVVEYIADQVAVMRAGRIVVQGVCAEVLQHPVDDDAVGGCTSAVRAGGGVRLPLPP